ncbi:transporter family-2 protein [Abditibacterium utsteinense]|uniref:Transporter family-2 protein n=1 Tax=Abditibacterium utsteinense TaxID=1960156 RepID=A0A2S8SVU9_9BACT|nr:DMT family transporter [Abditibacterium utsteinense]PQV64920.1 transporter family-2 protein [Abditibacterium utsteinense]
MITLLLALIAGAILPVQAAINATLRTPLGHAGWAAFASFFVGTVALGFYALVARLPFPQKMNEVAAWQWTGGLLGAVFVSLVVVLTPKLGPATTFGLIICGQLLASLVLDHFGWLGVSQHALSAPRVAGALFLLAGVFLIRKF